MKKILLLIPFLLCSCNIGDYVLSFEKNSSNTSYSQETKDDNKLDSNGTTSTTQQPEQIKLSENSIRCFTGSRGVLRYEFVPSSSSSSVTWKSSNDTKLTIADGNWIANESGSVTVSATTDNRHADYCTFTIVDPVSNWVVGGTNCTYQHPYYDLYYTIDTFIVSVSLTGSTITITVEALTVTLTGYKINDSSWNGRSAWLNVNMKILDNSNNLVVPSTDVAIFAGVQVNKSYSERGSKITIENVSVDKAPYRLVSA